MRLIKYNTHIYIYKYVYIYRKRGVKGKKEERGGGGVRKKAICKRCHYIICQLLYNVMYKKMYMHMNMCEFIFYHTSLDTRDAQF